MPNPLANRKVLIGVGVVGAGVAGYMIYKNQTKAKAAAASTAQAQAASGYGTAAAQYAYGYGNAYNNGYYGYGTQGNYYGYGASGGFSPTGYYGYGVTQPPGVTPNTTNAQWAQAAISQLSGEGYNPEKLSAVLGAYELGQPVSHSDTSIVDAAIGIEGYPPVPGPGGYPPAIKQGGQTNNQGGGKVRVPNVVGQRASVARQMLRTAGLKPSITNRAGGQVLSQDPKAGTMSDKGDTVTLHMESVRRK